jgi:multidrug efflux system membrane fusion protein
MDRMTEAALQTMRHHQQPSRRRKLVWVFIVTAILLVVLGGFYGFEKFREKMIGEFFAANKPPPTPVATVKAELVPVPRHLDGIGTVSAINQVTVSPQVAGRVQEILFDSGATVKAGTPLVQLDDGIERADLANFEAQARLAEVNLARAKALAKEKFGPQANVDQQRSNLEVARAGIARTKTQIGQKLINAPFNGTLGIRRVDIGQYVSAGMAIVTLTDLDTLYISFTLPENQRANLSTGLPVEIRSDAFPDRVFKAELTTIEPQIDPQTRNIRLQATMANPDHLLQPGMFVRARVVLPPENDGVTVPETAVTYTTYGESVFLIEENGKNPDGKPMYKAVQAFVDVATRYEGKAVITKGVKAGDMVVNGGQLRVFNGAAVVPTESDALEPPAVTPVE